MEISSEMMAVLSDNVQAQGYVKAGILGFPKSGKSYTAALFASVVKRHFKLPGAVAMFDTEGGSVYLRHVVKSLTNSDLLARRARSFDDLLTWGKICVKAGVAVAIVDSVTHPWRELCDAYLAQKNEMLERKNWRKQDKLEFQDWAIVKQRWGAWTDFYLNSPMHIIICGRAGFEYDYETNENGKKELIKTGVKMKTESEFGFEPSLLVEMERDQDLGGEQTKIVRRATVIGDRFSVIDGRTTGFPSTDDPEQAARAVYGFFKPHLDMLVSGSNATIDTDVKSGFDIDDNGDDGWAAERKLRVILCEEIQGEIVAAYPGQSAAEKKAKADILDEIFGTRSWTKVESTDSGKLRTGLAILREKLRSIGNGNYASIENGV